MSDCIVNDKFMQELPESLKPGYPALFLLVCKMAGDKVRETIRGTNGAVWKTSLDVGKEAAQRAALAAG